MIVHALLFILIQSQPSLKPRQQFGTNFLRQGLWYTRKHLMTLLMDHGDNFRGMRNDRCIGDGRSRNRGRSRRPGWKSRRI